MQTKKALFIQPPYKREDDPKVILTFVGGE